MIETAYIIEENRQLKSISTDEINNEFLQSNNNLWLDICDPKQEELEAWLDRLDITELPRAMCLDSREQPGFYPLNDELFLVIPLLADSEDGHLEDNVALLCNERLLLTIHLKGLFNAKKLSTLKQSQGWLPAPTIAALVAAMMLNLSITSLQRTMSLRKLVLSLEERMEQEPEKIEIEDIKEVKSQVLSLAVIVNDQLPAIHGLSIIKKSFFKLEDATEYITCAFTNLKTADASLTWLDQRVNALRSSFEMHSQEKTNRRLGMLTILSAIFMPITLLAGIWGMNFEQMPELGTPFGYPMALGIMVTIGTSMYLFFKRGGWF